MPGNAKRLHNGRTGACAFRTIALACMLASVFYFASSFMVPPSTASPETEELVDVAVQAPRRAVEANTYVSLVSRGQALYSANCLSCHGEAGGSVASVDLGSARYLRMLGDGRIIAAIYEGTDAMPGFGAGGGLGVPDVAALLVYIKSTASSGGVSTVAAGMAMLPR